MDPMLSGLLIGAIAIVIFTSSLLARMLKARRHRIFWVIFPWFLSITAVIGANIYQLDGLFALGAGVATFLVTFKLITGLELLGSLTVTVASVAMLGLSLAGGAIALQKSGAEANKFIASVVGFLPESQFYDLSFLGREKPAEDFLSVEEEEVFFSEADLLPDFKPTEITLVEKAFHELNPRSAGSMRGARVRLLKHNGDLLKGHIVGLEGSSLIINRYVAHKGLMKAPIPLATIKKLEVYR